MIPHVIALAGAAAGTALLALASDAAGEAPDYPALVIAALGLFGVLDRVARWAWRNRKVIQIAFRILHRLSQHGDPRQKAVAGNILRMIEVELLKESKEARSIAAKAVQKAKKTNGEDTETPTKRQKFVGAMKELGRFVPVVGRWF